MGVLDYPNLLTSIRNFGINDTEFYINSGVIIMNLKSMREFGIGKNIFNFATKHSLQYWDQKAINAVCGNNIKIIPFKYNYMTHSSKKEHIYK